MESRIKFNSVLEDGSYGNKKHIKEKIEVLGLSFNIFYFRIMLPDYNVIMRIKTKALMLIWFS